MQFNQLTYQESVTFSDYYFSGVVRDVAGNLVAIFANESGSTTPYYIYTDYLGSLRSITDANGSVL